MSPSMEARLTTFFSVPLDMRGRRASVKKTCAVTLMRNCSSHSWGVECEIPWSKEAPAPVMIPALLFLCQHFPRSLHQNEDLLDQDVDFASCGFGDFFSDHGEGVEGSEISFYGDDARSEMWLQLSCFGWISDDCYHEVLGILGELFHPFKLRSTKSARKQGSQGVDMGTNSQTSGCAGDDDCA
jgi:hypothetical protein